MATIKEVYPDVHYDNLGYVFPPYVTFLFPTFFFFLNEDGFVVGLKCGIRQSEHGISER